ncbi:MAG: pyrimidine dimer DNA glycosylase/endonuclease V [Treponema sp.]|nr:pyrimidine dimer DNA glycosylase/endonuclease V [Treponema sp.]
MRLWSIHPRHLDAKGLVALWREALLAQKVLEGRTRGYKAHPQLERFKASIDPLDAIGRYLTAIRREADLRGYVFDRAKILRPRDGGGESIPVAAGQIEYEWTLLRWKIRLRDSSFYVKIESIVSPDINPVFALREGGIESWERVKPLPPTSGKRFGPEGTGSDDQ